MLWRIQFNNALPQILFLICTDLGYHLIVVSIVQRWKSVLSMVFLYFQIVQHPEGLDTKICIVSKVEAKKKTKNVEFINFFYIEWRLN